MHGARNVGGGEYSIFYLIKNIDRRRYVPVVIYSKANIIIKKLNKLGIETIQMPIDQKILSLYRDQVSFNPIRLIIYINYLFNSVMMLRKIIKYRNIDIIHPHDNLSKIICALTAKSLGIKVVAHCRDLLNKTIIERFLLYFQVLFMDVIIAVSKANRDVFKLNKSLSKKVKVIYNGININEFSNIKNSHGSNIYSKYTTGFTIGIIGGFDRIKGHLYLFEAIKKLVSKGQSNLKCLVVGDGREKSKLTSWVRENSLNENIIFLGYKKDIASCLKVIDVLAIPSIQESFPRVALEAMAMGVPVVGSNVGGIPEAVINGKTGFIVSARDVISLAFALENFINNPLLIIKMGAEGKKRCELEFSMEDNVSKTQSIYNDLINVKV